MSCQTVTTVWQDVFSLEKPTHFFLFNYAVSSVLCTLLVSSR